MIHLGPLNEFASTVQIDDDIIFDISIAKPTGGGDPALHNWMKFEPLVKADIAENAAFYINQGGFLNNGKTNEVFGYGWNIGPGGGAVESGKPGIGEMWEQNYQTDGSGTGARLVEKHEIYLRPAGTQVRLSSYTINSDADTIQFYHSVDTFDFRSPTANLPFFIGAGLADYTALSIANISEDGEVYTINADFAVDGTSASLTFGQSTGKANNAFKTEGFNTARFPGSVLFAPLSGTASSLTLAGSDNSSKTVLSTDGTTAIINSITGNLQLAGSNTMVAEIRSTVINHYVNTTIGPQTSAVARLDVQNSAENVSFYADNTKGSGTKYAGILNVSGTGTSNRGLNISASGGTENIGIRIDSPVAGASNYAIKSEALAQSTFAGPIDIAGLATFTTIKITGGSPGSGKVLTSDADGDATWQTVAGTGDVVGPASSTDFALARFDGATGKLIQDSVAILTDTGELTTSGEFISIVTGTADAWGAYLQALEGSNKSGIGAFTDTSYFDVTVWNEDAAGGFADIVVVQAGGEMRLEGGGGAGGVTIKADGSIQLPTYTAGVLTSDGSGNITAEVAGPGGGASESFAIAMAIALG